MARIRSIHPDICIDMRLVEMDDARAERTFMRLWTHCDDDGRCIDDSRLIKSAIYPRLDAMTHLEVEVDIATLADFGFIVRYRSGKESYLHVPSFSKWQKPNRKVDSKLPAPPPQCVLSEDSVSTHNNVLPVVVVVVGEGEVDGEGGLEGDDESASPKAPKRKTKIPENFWINDSMRDWAKQNAIRSDIDRETSKFVDHFLSKGEVRLDWVGSWRNWMRNADEYTAAKQPKKSNPGWNGIENPPSPFQYDNPEDDPNW